MGHGGPPVKTFLPLRPKRCRRANLLSILGQTVSWLPRQPARHQRLPDRRAIRPRSCVPDEESGCSTALTPPDAPRAGLLNALVLPRPIGWISTLDAEGRANLAPYSFFNAVAYRPPQVMFSATGPHDRGGLKDTLANIAGHRRVRGQSRHLGPARGGQCQLDRRPARVRRVRPCRPRPSCRRDGAATARRREPRPPRMRAVADRRARIAAPGPARPHGDRPGHRRARRRRAARRRPGRPPPPRCDRAPRLRPVCQGARSVLDDPAALAESKAS